MLIVGISFAAFDMGQRLRQFTLEFNMIRQLKIRLQLIIGETLRESDGLASSKYRLRKSAMRKMSPNHPSGLTGIEKINYI